MKDAKNDVLEAMHNDKEFNRSAINSAVESLNSLGNELSGIKKEETYEDKEF